MSVGECVECVMCANNRMSAGKQVIQRTKLSDLVDIPHEARKPVWKHFWCVYKGFWGVQIMESLWEKKNPSTKQDYTREVNRFKAFLGEQLPTKQMFITYFSQHQSHARFQNSGVSFVYDWSMCCIMTGVCFLPYMQDG